MEVQPKRVRGKLQIDNPDLDKSSRANRVPGSMLGCVHQIGSNKSKKPQESTNLGEGRVTAGSRQVGRSRDRSNRKLGYNKVTTALPVV